MTVGCGARCARPMLDTVRWVRDNAALAYVGINLVVTVVLVGVGSVIGGR